MPERIIHQQGEDSVTKRKSEGVEVVPAQKRGRVEEEDLVDYGEDRPADQSEPANVPHQFSRPEQSAPVESPEDAERLRIAKALESWCGNNIAKENDDPDAEDRMAALAEVGLLLVFDHDKYPNAESMRAELEDIGSIIGGEQIVTRYINFILSLQNQLKKNRLQAERQWRHHQQMMQQFPPNAAFPFPAHGMMPMMMHPGGQMFVPHHHPMYMGQHGFPMQMAGQPVPVQAGRGNMTLNATGEMSEVQKRREKDRKRKEILAECTEHLKALLERVTKTTDQSEKAKIYELIDKVKKRIDSLKEVPVPQPVVAPKPPGPRGPIRGYYGNQYVNPQLLEKQKAEAGDQQHSVPE